MFAGKSYSGIGVDSNGYSIVGGGTARTTTAATCLAVPNPASPNNILAPFWTDLDGTGAPGIFAATLTDGVNTWIVLEWQVNVFGTSSLRVFQIWIGIDGTEDITYAYDPGNLPANPNGQDFQVGAENALGQGQFLLLGTLPTQDLRVSSSPGSQPVAHVHRHGDRQEHRNGRRDDGHDGTDPAGHDDRQIGGDGSVASASGISVGAGGERPTPHHRPCSGRAGP